MDNTKSGVEDEHAERDRLQDNFHKALLRVQLTRALGYDPLLLCVETRMLEGDGRLVGEGQQELFLSHRETVRIPPKHADAAHRTVAHSQRGREHGSESAATGQVRVAHPSVRLQESADCTGRRSWTARPAIPSPILSRI